MLNTTSIQQMLRRVDKVYQSLYKGRVGHPRLKNAKRFRSVEYRPGDGCKLSGDRFYIQHVGQIKVILHREIPAEATIKHVVVKRSLGRWYVCLMLELPDVAPVQFSRPDVGIDIGLYHLRAVSDGTIIDNPRWLRQNLAALRVAQRRLSRRKKGGSNWRKAVRQVAVLHERVANSRREFWHQASRRIVTDYGNIAIEDLLLAFMMRNGHLALSAYDSALGMFRQMLSYKDENTGSRLTAVKPARTSHICSGCGSVVVKSLNVRTHICPDCGLVVDRDTNAALNILALGRSAWALTCPVGEGVAQEAPPL